VGLITDFPSLKVNHRDELGPEGFILKSDGRSVYLAATQPRGVQHAVTTFLHRLGCRWSLPGDAWEIVPPRKTITGPWDLRQTPDFRCARVSDPAQF